ncbi:MAG: hypothetical protein ACREN5_10205, partial [Gemmatimonadales bacterium]
AQVPQHAWNECRSGFAACLERRDLPLLPVVNESRLRSLCGEIVVQRRHPVPWAWSRGVGEQRMPSTLLRLNAACGPAAHGALP